MAPKKDPEADLRGAIEKMSAADRRLAERLDGVIRAADPDLSGRLWYGQPAYAKGGKVVVFFRTADHDGERYTTLGVTSHARLDDGNLWPTSWAVVDVGPDEERRIADLVRRIG